MNALSPLGMVSDIPSENQTRLERREAQKDYFVEKDGVKFAGTHLLVDLWGASNLARSGADRSRAARGGARRPARRSCTAISTISRRTAACQRRGGAGGKPHLDPHVAGAGFRRGGHLHVRRLRSVSLAAGAEGGVPPDRDPSGRAAARPGRLSVRRS